MSLFKPMLTPDRNQTQLAYRIKFWPKSELSAAAKDLLRYSKKLYMSKCVIEELCSEDKTKLVYNAREWNLVWAYNNMPTEEEWNKVRSGLLLCVELRMSPAIDGGAVAILSFERPSERLAAHARGELDNAFDFPAVPLLNIYGSKK
jgi:hypothetical protein